MLRSVVRFHLAPQSCVQPFCTSTSDFWSIIRHGDLTVPARYDPLRAVAGTLWSCTKLTGAVQDESGGPTWYSDAGYTAPTFLTNTAAINAASHECADKVPAGGFVHIPAPEPGQ